MEELGILEELEIHLLRRQKGLLELERMTKELADTLSNNDRESANILLGMRQKEIEKTWEEDRAVRELLNCMDGEARVRIAAVLNGKERPAEDKLQEKRIFQTGEQSRAVTERIMRLDAHVSRRIAGKDSFYEKEK